MVIIAHWHHWELLSELVLSKFLIELYIFSKLEFLPATPVVLIWVAHYSKYLVDLIQLPLANEKRFSQNKLTKYASH